MEFHNSDAELCITLEDGDENICFPVKEVNLTLDGSELQEAISHDRGKSRGI